MSLERKDWIGAAAQLMATKSVDAVKVEVLAKQIGVSKGSFYWHFKDRADLLDSLLSYWEWETDHLIALANEADGPMDRMRRLFGAIRSEADGAGEFALDSAVFRWALRDEGVAGRVKAVEEKRIGYVRELLLADGRADEMAAFQAEVIYLAFLGYVDRAGRDQRLRDGETFSRYSRYLIEKLLDG